MSWSFSSNRNWRGEIQSSGLRHSARYLIVDHQLRGEGRCNDGLEEYGSKRNFADHEKERRSA
jgi:hypothetical protein